MSSLLHRARFRVSGQLSNHPGYRQLSEGVFDAGASAGFIRHAPMNSASASARSFPPRKGTEWSHREPPSAVLPLRSPQLNPPLAVRIGHGHLVVARPRTTVQTGCADMFRSASAREFCLCFLLVSHS